MIPRHTFFERGSGLQSNGHDFTVETSLCEVCIPLTQFEQAGLFCDVYEFVGGSAPTGYQ